MADIDFQVPTVDLDGPGIDDDYSFDLPDAPSECSARVKYFRSIRGELREAEL